MGERGAVIAATEGCPRICDKSRAVFTFNERHVVCAPDFVV